MKSYTESLGHEKIDYAALLQKENIDWQFIIEQSKTWHTCPCGQLSVLIPRRTGEGSDHGPHDVILTYLGKYFYDLVRYQNKQGAIDVLYLLSAREKQVLASTKYKIENELADARHELMQAQGKVEEIENKLKNYSVSIR